ncbi:MAG TPA: HisS family protein [Chloroflexota bacterium]|nr:HisS family protein [Chloroflexota bacterium]
MTGGVEQRRPVERVRGTQDAWPAEAHPLAAVRAQLERTFASFGYRRIEVPVIEPAELHLRKSGLDIISKLYAFEDQGGRQLCLRPELTASVVRAFVAQPPARLPARLFSTGPVFRYERPSRGRFRQFTHSGVELIGAQGPLADAEVVLLAAQALDALGLRDYTITVGHVGVLTELLTRLGLAGRLRAFLLESAEEARRRGVVAVRQRLAALDPELFEDGASTGGAPAAPIDAAGRNDTDDPAQIRAAVAAMIRTAGLEGLGRRAESDVVERMVRKLAGRSQAEAVDRALGVIDRLGALRGTPDAVLAGGREVLEAHSLSDAPLRSLAATRDHLVALGLDTSRLTLDLGLSRGLQYYTGMVFEIDHAALGSESQLCGGGRYDDLVRALGGRQPAPALGFAFGVERVALALAVEGRAAGAEASGELFVVPASAAAAGAAGRAAQALRAAGLRVHLDVTQRPVRNSLQFADREGFTHVAVVTDVPDSEAAAVRLRDMRSGEERDVALSEVPAALAMTPPVAV